VLAVERGRHLWSLRNLCWGAREIDLPRFRLVGSEGGKQNSWIIYTLSINVENLPLLTAAVFGIGNSLNSVITDNAAANTIEGGVGACDERRRAQ